VRAGIWALWFVRWPRKTTESEGEFAFGALGILYADVRIFRFEFERKKRMAALIEFR
jgi:hypothetical protein